MMNSSNKQYDEYPELPDWEKPQQKNPPKKESAFMGGYIDDLDPEYTESDYE